MLIHSEHVYILGTLTGHVSVFHGSGSCKTARPDGSLARACPELHDLTGHRKTTYRNKHDHGNGKIS